MSRPTKVALAALLVLLVTAAVARADHHSGTLRDVFADRNLFVVEDDEGVQQMFQVDYGATISINGMPAVLEELEQGDFVEVTFRWEEDNKLAVDIQCRH